MNKTQLIEAMAEEARLTKGESKRALDAFVKVTGDALGNSDKVVLVGFGTFSVSKRPAAIGRNFRTGAPVKIASKNVVKFKAGVELCAKVD